jgi:hypothetical protein
LRRPVRRTLCAMHHESVSPKKARTASAFMALPAITGDVYGHTSDDTARAAVDGLAGRLGL